jgi:hypothetical protein
MKMITLRAVALAALLALALPVAADAQTVVAPGDRARLLLTPELREERRGFWITGTVTEARVDSLWLQAQQPTATSGFAAYQITRLEVHRGSAPFGRGKGLLIGAAIGAALGAAVEGARVQGAARGSEDEAWASVSIPLAGLAGAVVGGATGWVAGGRQVDAWHPARLPPAPGAPAS